MLWQKKRSWNHAMSLLLMTESVFLCTIHAPSWPAPDYKLLNHKKEQNFLKKTSLKAMKCSSKNRVNNIIAAGFNGAHTVNQIRHILLTWKINSSCINSKPSPSKSLFGHKVFFLQHFDKFSKLSINQSELLLNGDL